MAFHLRHGEQVALAPGGWARVDDVLAELGTRVSRDELLAVVASGDKPRFELSIDGTLVRARYGHSRDVDLRYEPTAPPPILYHGTATTVVPVVLREGVRRQGRRYVHLSETVDTATQVGARHGVPAVLHVAAGDMAADGHRFFNAAAGIWLTDVVPARYLDVGG